MPPGRRAFTLIELLVVITIIVVLLALLVPAMDRAIYQAELTMCAANQKAVSSTVVVYASGSKRYYPYRALAENQGVKASHIYNANAELDDRRLYRDYFGVNASLNDPLNERVDYEGSQPDSAVESSYSLWFGWRWKETAHAGRAMSKIGDRFTFNETAGPNTGLHKFNLLMSDRDVFSQQSSFAHASHADRAGTMYNLVLQDGDATGQGLPVSVLKVTFSRWQLDGQFARGPLDLNFAVDDGSVARHTGVSVDVPSGGRVFSDRGVEMIGVNEYNNDFAEGSDGYIPAFR